MAEYGGFPDPSDRYRARLPRRAIAAPAREADDGFPLPFGGMPQQPKAAPAPRSEDDSYDPGWAYGPDGDFSGNQLQQNLITQGGRGGIWDPRGSRPMIEALRRLMQQRGRARESRALTEADAMAPNDPYFSMYAREGALQSAQSDQERALMEAIVQSIMENQRGSRDLTSQYLGQAINRKDPKSGEGLAAAGGQVGGALIGGLIGGPPGAMAGAGVGGGVSRSVPQDRWSW